MDVTHESLQTPLMRQYWEIKKQHQDAILLFRLGDFYEMFFDDAQVASKILNIALTSRDKSAEQPVPLCGVPHHSVSGYISKLLDVGHKVAICEQVEDPKEAKGIVRREVVRVITPGLQTDLEGLAATETNPLVSIYSDGRQFGLAWLDANSGLFQVTMFPTFLLLEEEIWRLSPREVIVPEGKMADEIVAWASVYQGTTKDVRFEKIPAWVYDKSEQRLKERFQVATLEGYGIAESRVVPAAAAALLYYVEDQNRNPLPHLRAPKPYTAEEAVYLDAATRDNLELFRSRTDWSKERTLLSILDETQTAMGARTLRDWIGRPLRTLEPIQDRLNAVEELSQTVELRERLRSELAHIYDLERLVGRIATERANARDLVALRTSLARTIPVKENLGFSKSTLLQQLNERVDVHATLCKKLEQALVDDPPITIKEGGVIREGFHAEVDDLRKITGGGRQWIAEMEAKERQRTGISSLKVGYNRVFGYFIEVTKTHLAKVPSDYLRKQTLTNGERYVTPELKEQESKILSAEEKLSKLEFELFEQLRKEVTNHLRSLQKLADTLAQIDTLCSFGRVAARYRYVRPKVSDDEGIVIRGGRHPVVERFLTEHPFVPNDIEMNCSERQLIILTGPNMAGKSTIMRQVAIITLMAQVGSFVPADEAAIGIVDRIFTRVGASDDLARGRSTFMVEMSETANILRNASGRSLVLLDEIGRGTSTYDGLSIAWAVAEDLHDRVKAKTIFATHYHELTDLARTKDRAKNMNVAVKEWGDQIVFLRTLEEGAANRSYGIEVARLAGVPVDVIERAKTILANLEKGELDSSGRPAWVSRDPSGSSKPQMDLFYRMGDELLAELNKVAPDEISAKQALEILYAWRNRYRIS